MDGFRTAWLSAPYLVVRGHGEASRIEALVSGRAEVPVVAEADAPLAARLVRGPMSVEYRSIGGRLFRSFVDPATGLPEEAARAAPPVVWLSGSWRDAQGHRSSFLGSRFRRGEGARFRARPPTMHGVKEDRLADAERGIAGAGADMAEVAGRLYHVARAPCWGLSGAANRAAAPALVAVVPDLDEPKSDALVDARVDPEEALGALSLRVPVRPSDRRAGTIEVLEPSLLPDTADEDAVASVARDVQASLARVEVGSVDRDFLRHAFALFDAVEVAMVAGPAGYLSDAREAISRLAAEAPTGHDPRDSARAGVAARCRVPALVFADGLDRWRDAFPDLGEADERALAF